MNEHAGPACALSGLIVGVFAILLHDHGPPPPAPKSTAASTPDAGSPKPEGPPAIQQARSNAIAAPPAPIAKAPVAISAVVIEAPRSPEPEGAPRPAEAKPLAGPKPSKRRPPPGSPRPSFAIVEPEESLADVAARVYGSEDAAEALWKANRDQVERVDSPLARGTLLRTP